MKYLASTKDEGADPAGTTYTYTDVWDATKIFGCYCNDGYYGPDCSLRDCPTGDDPLTGTTSDT